MSLAEQLSGNFDASADASSPAENTGFRAPLLWILLPQICAGILCANGFALSRGVIFPAVGISLFFAACALVCAFARKFCKSARARENAGDLWKFFLPAAVFFLAGAWQSSRIPEVAEMKNFPETEVRATLEIDSVFRSRGRSWTGIARVENVSEAGHALAGKLVYFQFAKKECAEVPFGGQRLRLRGVLRGVRENAFFKEEFREFLLSKGVGAAIALGDEIELLGAGTFSETCTKIRRGMISKLIVPGSAYESESRMLGAMLFGEYDLLFPDQIARFRATGSLHIFAISGLHISILALVLFRIFSLARKIPYWACAAATLAILFCYISVAGASTSSLRAWAMIAFLFAAKILCRRSGAAFALIFAASLSLWFAPELLGSLSFRLSYGVVAAILFYGSPLNRFLVSLWMPARFVPANLRTRAQRFRVAVYEKFVGLFAISFSAFLAGACFVVADFELFTPLSIFVNVLLVPVAGVMLCLAFFSAVFCGVPAMSVFAEFSWAADCRLARVVEIFSAIVADVPAILQVNFPAKEFGGAGGGVMLVLFALGETDFLRSRPLARFAIPPVFLLAYLLAFAR